MAIRNPFMSKVVEGDVAFSLQAEAGRSLLVTGVFISNPASNYVSLLTERVTVGYWRTGGELGNHLHPLIADFRAPNLLGTLIAAGMMKGYPVGEGETFIIEDAKQADAFQIVNYIEADAGDFKPTDPNGSKAMEYLYLSYGRYSTTLTEGDNIYVTPQTPAEFPAFPFGAVVPANMGIALLGIAASDVIEDTATGTNVQETSRLKLTRNREVLFDPDRLGLEMNGGVAVADDVVVGAGVSLLGNNSDTDQRPVFMLPVPLVFKSGEELLVTVTTILETGAVNLAAVTAEVGMIQRVSR